MASGLPVITTTATAGPDIITQNKDGWIMGAGDLDALVETMRFCLENRDEARGVGITARATAERFSWEAYGDRWAEILLGAKMN
jgi:glycosyltransferase involved in cell wall biosynthesis